MNAGQHNNKTKDLKWWIKNLVIFFIIFNIVMYGSVIVKQATGRPYPVAKSFMASATLTNQAYIFPLSKVFGIHSIPTKPFYIFRNWLFKQGWQRLPADDAEREMWWIIVWFDEFHNLYERPFADYVRERPSFHPIDPHEVFEWTNKFYPHLEQLAKTSRMADPDLKKRRLEKFEDLANAYLLFRESYIYNTEQAKAEVNYPYNFSFFTDSVEMQKLRNVLAWYFSIKAERGLTPMEVVSAPMDKAALDEYVLIFNLTNRLLLFEILTKQDYCHFDLLPIYAEVNDYLVDVSDSKVPSRKLSKEQLWVLNGLLQKDRVYFANRHILYCKRG